MTGPVLLLRRLGRIVHRRSTTELMGIALKDLAALAYLRDHEGASQQAMCEGLCVDANYGVLLLNQLEAAGYVERLRDPEDRRHHLARMTDAGRAALGRAERAQETIADEILAGLDPQERTVLAELLRRALVVHDPAPQRQAVKAEGGQVQSRRGWHRQAVHRRR